MYLYNDKFCYVGMNNYQQQKPNQDKNQGNQI